MRLTAMQSRVAMIVMGTEAGVSARAPLGVKRFPQPLLSTHGGTRHRLEVKVLARSLAHLSVPERTINSPLHAPTATRSPTRHPTLAPSAWHGHVHLLQQGRTQAGWPPMCQQCR